MASTEAYKILLKLLKKKNLIICLCKFASVNHNWILDSLTRTRHCTRTALWF